MPPAKDQKILKRLVDGLKPEFERYEIRDTEIPGFMMRVYPNGKKVFICYYRVNGVRRRPTLGVYPSMTVEQARNEAMRHISEAHLGRDLSQERQDLRAAETFKKFAELYMEDAEKRVAKRTQQENQRRLKLHLLPELGNKRLSTITQPDMIRLHKQLSEKKPLLIKSDKNGEIKTCTKKTTGGVVNANKCLSLLKTMFKTAEIWGLIPEGTNPCRNVKPFKEKSRERYLTPDEFKRLAEALQWAEKEQKATPWAVSAIRLLILTGCRLSEILTLKWDFVDAEAKCLRLPDSKTGAKVVHLNAPALEVLLNLYQLRDEESPWVILGHVKGNRLVNLTKPWYRIREKAELPDLRIHDLRHCYAGIGASLGLGLPIVGKLLGHTQGRTTERYANLAPDPVQAAAEQIGERLMSLMNGQVKVYDLNQHLDKADES